MISERPLAARAVPALAIAGALASAALVGGAVVSGRVSSAALLLAPLGVGAALAVLASLRWPWLGIALLPVVGVAVPFGIGTGTQSQIVAALSFALALLGLWLLRALAARELTVARSPVSAPALAVALVWALSFAYGNALRPPLVQAWASAMGDRFLVVQAGGLAVAVVSTGVLLLALNAGRDPRSARLATWGLLGVSALALAAFYLRVEQISRYLSTFGLFTMWVVALAYGQALFNRELARPIRLGLLALAAGWLYKALLLETSWFSGWVPTLVAIVVITLLRSRRAFVALALTSAVLIAVNRDQLYVALWEDKVVAEGDLTRLDIWGQTLRIVQDNPLLGTGPAGYAAYNMSVFVGSESSMSTHSNYLDVVVQTGLIGTATFAWLLIALGVVAVRAMRRHRAGFAGGFARGASGGLVGVLAAMGLGDWLIPFVYNQTIAGFRYTVHSWVFLGLLAALATLEPPEVG